MEGLTVRTEFVEYCAVRCGSEVYTVCCFWWVRIKFHKKKYIKDPVPVYMVLLLCCEY